jgi:chromosome segregation ATPase
MAPMTGNGWPSPPRETLAARALRAASAERRVAELEDQLDLAHEELLRRQNEIDSLQKSLELNASENSRLSSLLDEHSAAAEKTKSQNGRLARALVKEKRARDEADERRQTESSELSTRVEAALARAIAAEALLSEAQRDLSACKANNTTMEQKIADAESAVEEKEQKIHELVHSRLLLIDELSRLQTMSQVRDADLARAKENQSLLADLVVQLEAKMGSTPPLRHARGGFGNGGPTGSAVLKHDLAKDTWLLGPLPPVDAA